MSKETTERPSPCPQWGGEPCVWPHCDCPGGQQTMSDQPQTTKWPMIRIIIFFADGEKMETAIDAEQGAFSFSVQADCPAVTRFSIAAPGSKVEFLP